MNKQQVLELIGEKYIDLFNKFMHGQTVGMNKDGTIDYYEYDVERFMRFYGIKSRK